VVACWLLLHVSAANQLRRVDLLLVLAFRLDLLPLRVGVVLLLLPRQLDRLQLHSYVHLLECVILQLGDCVRNGVACASKRELLRAHRRLRLLGCATTSRILLDGHAALPAVLVGNALGVWVVLDDSHLRRSGRRVVLLEDRGLLIEFGLDLGLQFDELGVRRRELEGQGREGKGLLRLLHGLVDEGFVDGDVEAVRLHGEADDLVLVVFETAQDGSRLF
jgi:hypothetical protein